MFYTFIRYWKTFQYSASDFKRYFFTLYHGSYFPISVFSQRFISWSSPLPSLLFSSFLPIIIQKFPICLEMKYYLLRKPTLKIFHVLQAVPNFSFFCFHWKITWHLGKVNKTVKRVSNWTDAQFTSFNVSSFLLPKTTNKLVIYFVPFYVWYSKNVCS